MLITSLHHHHPPLRHRQRQHIEQDGAGEEGAEAAGNNGVVLAGAVPSALANLVLACAILLRHRNLDAARLAARVLLSAASPRAAAAADRLAYHFAHALALRVDAAAGHVVAQGMVDAAAARTASSAAYLAFNQIAPFLRFAHLTANQAILDAVEGARRIHILDLDVAHGVQWPLLLQAIAERADPATGPPDVRITGAGADGDTLLLTGSCLRAFARSIQLPFHFTPLLLSAAHPQQQVAASLELYPDETLAVNCVMFLHNLSGHDELAAFLRWVKAMAPVVVTIAERENRIGDFVDRIDDLPRRAAVAMDHYLAVFEALEASRPPLSQERLMVEQVLGREIDAALGPAGGRWWRGLEGWGAAAHDAGFAERPLSAFAVSQARLLLRQYPSGYELQEARGACSLGWQTRPLLSVSAWQPNHRH